MTLTLKPQDEKLVIVFAFRYAFGGTSLGQHSMGDYIKENWASFGQHTKEALRQTARSFSIADTKEDLEFWSGLRNFMMEN